MIIPVIPNIHQTLLEAVSRPNALDMGDWHKSVEMNEQGAYCGTTHCRAGWVVALGGKESVELEKQTSTLFASMMIYKKSSEIKVSPNEYFKSNEEAMNNIKECAELEIKLNS